jgi:hemoglobin/transferrin/lactoferrin receptor protein
MGLQDDPGSVRITITEMRAEYLWHWRFMLPLAAGLVPGVAQEPHTLEPMLVTAARYQSDVFTAPYCIATLTDVEMEERLVRSLPEALGQTPGVMVQKTSNGQGSPYIRGFTGYRTLALIDGVRYNNSIYRDGPSEYISLIDVQALAGLELIQGPASVLYGSDAIGGALCMNTRGTDYLTESGGQAFIHGRSFYRGATAEQSHLGRFEAQTGVGGLWGLHLGTSLKSFGNVDGAGLGRQPFTGYDETAWDARLDMKLNDAWSVTVACQRLMQDDVWRTHATVYGRSFAGTTVGDDLRRSKDQDRFLSYVKLTGEDLEGLVDRAVITASLQGWQEDGIRIRQNRRQELEYLTSRMWGLDVQLESATKIGRLTYGVDYYEDHVDTSRTDYNADGSVRKVYIQGPVGDDTVYGMFGAFIQDRIQCGERLELTLGGRFNSVRADIGKYENPLTGLADSLDEQWRNLIGSVRVSYAVDPQQHWRWYGGLSQAFRAPNTADLTRFGASRSTEIESAATNLEPENFLTLESGIKVEQARFSGGLSVFHTWMSDYITSTPTGRIIDGQVEVTKRNSSKGFVQGVEVWANWQLDAGFRLFGNFTWLKGEADAFPDASTGLAVREPLSRIQPVTVTGGIRWTQSDDAFWLELSVTAAAKADQLNSADRMDTQRIPPGGTPGYAMVNLRGAWLANDHVTLHAGLENLLDQAYRAHGSGSNEPGFGAVLGVDVRF